MSVYISAYYENINTHRTSSFYIEKSLPFLLCNVPKIIFIPESLFPIFQPYENTFTRFVILNTIPYQKYKDCFTNFQIDSSNGKDTIDYVLLNSSKTAFIQVAIEKFPEYEIFCWLDFGIAHCCIKNEITVEIFQQTLENILISSKATITNNNNKIRIPGCWSIHNINQNTNMKHVSNQILWYFCGGFFAGHKNSLRKFASFVEEKILQLCEEKFIMWEVNIWYLIAREYPELFDWYYGDHNISMLNNFIPI